MNVTLFGNRIVADDQVKMRLLRCVLIQYGPCPYQKRQFGHVTDMHIERVHVKMEERLGLCHRNQRTQKITSQLPVALRKA